MKLSRAQIEALNAAPFAMSFWGGKPQFRWPGKFTLATVSKLLSEGLLRSERDGHFAHKYFITPAGREALAQLCKP